MTKQEEKDRLESEKERGACEGKRGLEVEGDGGNRTVVAAARMQRPSHFLDTCYLLGCLNCSPGSDNDDAQASVRRRKQFFILFFWPRLVRAS